jgi:hypothetical protein
MKQSMTQSTYTSSRLAKASQLGKNLSAVPVALQGEKTFYSSKPSMKQSMTQSTYTSSRRAKTSQLGKNLSAVPVALH